MLKQNFSNGKIDRLLFKKKQTSMAINDQNTVAIGYFEYAKCTMPKSKVTIRCARTYERRLKLAIR